MGAGAPAGANAVTWPCHGSLPSRKQGGGCGTRGLQRSSGRPIRSILAHSNSPRRNPAQFSGVSAMAPDRLRLPHPPSRRERSSRIRCSLLETAAGSVAKAVTLNAATVPRAFPSVPALRSRSSKPRCTAETGSHPRPTSCAPTCPEIGRGFGEDCLSVHGSSGWVFRSIAEGREFRSRRPISGLEGTGTPASPRSGARTQAAGDATPFPPLPLTH